MTEGRGQGTNEDPEGRSQEDPFERYSGKPAGPAMSGSPRITGTGDAEITAVEAETIQGPPAPFGDAGLSAIVTGVEEPGRAMLLLPFDATALKWVDLPSIRLFEVRGNQLIPVWASGVNRTLGYVWAKLARSGTYRAIGLPRDVLLREALKDMARRRRYLYDASEEDQERITAEALALFRDAPTRDLQQLRQLLTEVEIQAGKRPFAEAELQRSAGFHLAPFPLPGGRTLAEFREFIGSVTTPAGGFPEEELFFDPDALEDSEPPPWAEAGSFPFPFPFPGWTWPWPGGLPEWLQAWSESRDWWMYHHDQRHTGLASGVSKIRSTTVGSLSLRHSVSVSGTVFTIPSVVKGKVYVGSSGATGYMYKIDLASGTIDHAFPVLSRYPAYAQGIGGSPAVADGRVYFTALPGVVYCLNAATFAQVWSLDLRVADAAANQPVNNPVADCWSSPLVVGENVYIGCGEGESGAWGFVYCLHAETGRVRWLFSTDKFSSGAHNNPNVIPASAVGLSPLPAGFTSAPDPPAVGVNVWSSLAYDVTHHRLWVGTGNTQYDSSAPLPDPHYGSGILALDAGTGAFAAFIAPTPADCYRADDQDADVCGSPTLFRRADKTMVAIGTKAGAFFVIDAGTYAVHARRNVLPYFNNNPANPIPSVDPNPPGGGENRFGVFGTPAADPHRRRLYVCLGGWDGLNHDASTIPFVRALDWDTLDDAWPGAFDAAGVWKYTVAAPPIYSTPQERGVGSPAVVHDVVLVGTTKPALYAFDADTGLCLWTSTGLSGQWVMGPAVYGNHVVIGCGSDVLIYST